MTRLTMLMGMPAALTAVVLTAVALAGCGKATATSSAQIGNGAPGADFCTAAQTAKVSFDALAGSLSGQPTLPTLKGALQVATGGIDGLDSSAGTDISADTHKLRAAIDDANQKIQAATDLSGAQTALSGLESADYKSAGSRVDAYAKSHCGDSIDASGSGTSSASSSASGAGTGSSSSTTTSSSTS